jgi:hypothetical protein
MVSLTCQEVQIQLQQSEKVYFLYCFGSELPQNATIEGSVRVPAGISVPELLRKLGESGVKNDGKLLVCYSTSGFEGAAEVWWLLHSHGRANTAVLIGGLTQWLSAGLPVTAHQPLSSFMPASDLGYSLVNERLITMKLPIYQLIDTIGASDGEVYFDPEWAMKVDGTLESPGLILDLLELSGVAVTEQIVKVVAGPRAGVALLLMTHAGLSSLAMYIDKARLEDTESEGSFYSLPRSPLFLSFLPIIDPDPLPPHSTPHSESPIQTVHSVTQSIHKRPKEGTTDTCVHCALL